MVGRFRERVFDLSFGAKLSWSGQWMTRSVLASKARLHCLVIGQSLGSVLAGSPEEDPVSPPLPTSLSSSAGQGWSRVTLATSCWSILRNPSGTTSSNVIMSSSSPPSTWKSAEIEAHWTPSFRCIFDKAELETSFQAMNIIKQDSTTECTMSCGTPRLPAKEQDMH